MKKLKVLPSILMLITCVAILGVGVFAVAPTQNTISGTITINSANPEILISAYKYDEDGNMEETPFLQETKVRSGIDINVGNLVFDTSSCNTEEDLKDADIKITIRISNPSSTKLGVYFSKTAVSTNATSEDVAKEKDLKDSTGSIDNVKAKFDAYKPLDAKATENGVVDTTITFSLKKFVTDANPTIDLESEDNKIYLNIEIYNDDLYDLDAIYESMGYTVVGKGQTTFTHASYTEAGSPEKVKVAEGVITIESITENYGSGSPIKEIICPTTLKEIKDSALQGSQSLTKIEFNDGLEKIGTEAFWECNLQGNIFIPKSVTYFGSRAFKYNFGINKIYFEHESANLIDTSEFLYYNEIWNEETQMSDDQYLPYEINTKRENVPA